MLDNWFFFLFDEKYAHVYLFISVRVIHYFKALRKKSGDKNIKPWRKLSSLTMNFESSCIYPKEMTEIMQG